MALNYDILGVAFIANQIIGAEVKQALGDCFSRGVDAVDRGDYAEATQAFSETAASVARNPL